MRLEKRNNRTKHLKKIFILINTDSVPRYLTGNSY